VSIGDRAVIGAGAVVRDAVPNAAVAVGVPARVVGQRDAAAVDARAPAVPGLESR
jgi:acetyltransferase-like isoleucine patch superfamily enzyme